MAEQVLSLLIKVSKDGNGDKETIASLEKLQKGSASASTSLDGLRVVGSRSGESLLRLAGVNETVVKSLKAVELGHHAAEKGALAAALATGGLVAVVGGAVSVFQSYAKQLDEAGKAEVESAHAAGEAEERRRKTLERLGLTAKATKAEIVAFVEEQIAAAGRLEASAQARDAALTFQAQEAKIAAIQLGGGSKIRELQLQQAGVGASGLSAIDSESGIARAALQARLAAAGGKTDAVSGRRNILEGSLLQQEGALGAIADKTSDAYKKGAKELERTRTLLAEVNREAEIAANEQVLITREIEEQNKLLDLQSDKKKADFQKEQDEKKARGLEKQLSIQEQFQSALEDQFQLDAKLKGIEDDRVAQAYAYLQATGQSHQASRLLSLELEKQKNTLTSQVSILGQAGSQIARLGGLNVDAISAQGATLSDRSQLRNLASGFNSQLSGEERRLRKSGIKDEELIQQKLATFSESQLGNNPTLRRALGITAAEEARKSGGENKEEENILKNVDLAKSRAANTKELASLAKEEAEFHKEFGDYTKTMGDTVKRTREQMKALADELRSK